MTGNDDVKNFNLRVYGLLIVDGAVLVTDENRGGVCMTKFPGGGLEKGEGLIDGLKREFFEELNIEISVESFYYVNDFLQISAFNAADQLLSFYYMVTSDQIQSIPIQSIQRFVARGEQDFRWVKISDMEQEMFTFPIDQFVCRKLKA